MMTQKEDANILVFLVLTLIVSLPFYAMIARSGHMRAGGRIYITCLMWAPAVAAFLTVHFRSLGMRSLGLRWGGLRYASLGYAIPIAYAGIAYILIWSLGFGFFPDPATIASKVQTLGWSSTAPARFVPLYFLWLAIMVVPPSLLMALGEEIGWRGFLAPAMVGRFGFTPGAILVGIIWAAWHLPLLLFSDYNNGTPWWFALPCFCALTIGISIIMTWLRLASNSIWPCALLHATHNVFIELFFTPLTGSRGPITAYVIDEFGLLVPAVVLLFALFVWFKRRTLATVQPRMARV